MKIMKIPTTPSMPLDSSKFSIYDFINVYLKNGSIINNLVTPKNFNPSMHPYSLLGFQIYQ